MLQITLIYVVALSAIVARVSRGRLASVELSRRLTGWAYIVCATSVLTLCFVADYQTDSAWRQLEILFRIGVGIVCVIAIVAFHGRLKRDLQVEAGRRADYREDAESAYRRQTDPTKDPHRMLYRGGWLFTGLGLAVLFAIALTSSLLERVLDQQGPGRLAVYGVIVFGTVLLLIGYGKLRRYRNLHR